MIDTLRDALRSLRRSPGFALLTVAILAVGVGLSAAIFTVVDCVLLRPLGYHDADRIVSVQTRNLRRNVVRPGIGGGDYVDVATEIQGIESAAYYNNWDGAVQVRRQADIVPLAHVSPRFGEVMGVEPVTGRLFGHDDAKGSGALVSAAFAREHFGTAQEAVGQALREEAGLFTVVGVLPDGFSFPGNTSVWLEEDAVPENLNRTAYNQYAVAKRRAGVSKAALDAELAAFSQRLQQSWPEDKMKAIEAVPLQDLIVGKLAPTLRLLMGSVAVLLLIVCANITHLQLIRATRQMREIAVRTALGASRGRIAARALWEAALLSLAGCAGALLLAQPALRLLVHLAPTGLPRLHEVRLNGDVLLYSVFVSFVVMAVTALLPVWRLWQVREATVLRQDSTRGTEGRGAARLRGAFLISQVACTLVLTAAAVLLARQLIAQSHESLGFDLERLYTLDSNAIQPDAPAAGAAPASPEAKRQVLEARHAGNLVRLNGALDTLRATPGVTEAEAIDGAPLGFGGSDVGYAIRGRSVFAPPFRDLPSAQIRPVTPGALTTLRVPLLRGRALNDSDMASAPHVLLINRALAEEQFHGEDPVGKQIMCGYDESNVWWTIAGVVGDIKDAPGRPADPTFYVPVAQHPSRAPGMQLLVRIAPGAGISAEALRQRLAQAHPEIASTATTMAQNFNEVERDLRFRSLLFESFAGVSILLAMLGMYGATAYSVAQRTFEFGVRMALGSTREQVVGNVLRKALGIALTGAIAGLALYAALLRVAASLLGKLPHDPIAVALAAIGVVALSLVAAAVPARRASSIDPIRALRVD